ncbi:hypothetical protein [Pseudomonas corrugata]|uniref:hypothetical protein n=1 Tax=Pseudomonas corrugata TaxID=47879 RepID=UPI0006D8D2B0|nr:hypothetical protein [Pseudomonas corrugata]
MLTVLSLLDNRLRPKGSRDPLAIESIWSSVGRKAVGNLTTVTSRMSHFMVALLACRYAHTGMKSRPLEDVQQRYARAEQLSAYLRLHDSVKAGPLGSQLAIANLKRDSMELGIHKKAQILSNQLSYGLWGLYSSALQAAGLIKGSERRLTDRGVALTDLMLQVFGDSRWQRFEDFAGRNNVTRAQLSLLAPDFAALLNDKSVRKHIVLALLNYQGAGPLQVALFEAVNVWLLLPGDKSSVRDFIQWALTDHSVDPQLQDVLKQILLLQPVLVFANTLVAWLQSQKGRSRSDLIDDLSPRLTAPFLPLGWSRPGLPHLSFLQSLVEAANRGDAASVIEQIVIQNSVVMGQRGGAAWLHWEADKLRVRVPVDRAWLPEDLCGHCGKTWDYSFFLHSFLTIAKAGQ